MADRWGYGYTFPNLTNSSPTWTNLTTPSRLEPSAGAAASNQHQPSAANYNRGLNPYACSECGYSFYSATTEDITRHMLSHIGPRQPAATSAMGHSMYGGMPSTVTSSASNGVNSMNSYHNFSQSNAFPSAYPQSAFPEQQRPSHSTFPGHERVPQNAFPGHDRLSQSAFPRQETPSQSAFPGQERSSLNAFPGQDRPSLSAFPGQDRPSLSAFPGQEHLPQSAFPGQERQSQSTFPGQEHQSQSAFSGQEHPSPSAFPGQERQSQSAFPGQELPSQNIFPGQNRPAQSLFPGQSPPQNAFSGQPQSINVFPGQMPPHYSQPKPPPLIPAPHLQKQLANQQKQLDNRSIIESIYSYPHPKSKDSIPPSNQQESNSISKPKESDTTNPKESDPIPKPKESDQKIEPTLPEIIKTKSEKTIAIPILSTKVGENVNNYVAEDKAEDIENIEGVTTSQKSDDSDENSSSIKPERDESFTVPPKKLKPDPEMENIKTSETPLSPTTEKDKDSKKFSITPFAHMNNRAIQKDKSKVLNFFPNKHKASAAPKKTKPKEAKPAPKPAAPKPLKPRGTSTRGLRAKAEVNYAVLDDPYDFIKDPDKDKTKVQPPTIVQGFKETIVQGFKEIPGKVLKSPVKKMESSEDDTESGKVKTEPNIKSESNNTNGESGDANGEGKTNLDEAASQFADHPLFSILGGEEEWNEHVGEAEEPEQPEHIDLSSFLSTDVSADDIINPNAPRNKAPPVFTSNPTEWGYPEKPSKDYSGKRYQCDYCDYGSSELTNIKTHIRGHTGEKPYKCSICDFASSRSNSIKMHMRTHTGEKPFKCDLCGKAFTKSSNLIVHRKTHTGEKDYKCALCGDAFITPGELKKHIRSHTGEKPYKCKHCEQRFSDSSTLQRHTKTHTGEKPYECDICGKTFTRGDTLTHHRRTHTGEKPYKCSLCPYAFIQSCRLKQHMMKAHFGHLQQQALKDTEETIANAMGESIPNESGEPDSEGNDGIDLDQQALEHAQSIIAKAMQISESAEGVGSGTPVKRKNFTDRGLKSRKKRQVKKDDSDDDVDDPGYDPGLPTKSQVKTDSTDDEGNQIEEEAKEPESAKTLYKIKTWKKVNIKKPKHYQY